MSQVSPNGVVKKCVGQGESEMKKPWDNPNSVEYLDAWNGKNYEPLYDYLKWLLEVADPITRGPPETCSLCQHCGKEYWSFVIECSCVIKISHEIIAWLKSQGPESRDAFARQVFHAACSNRVVDAETAYRYVWSHLSPKMRSRIKEPSGHLVKTPKRELVGRLLPSLLADL